MCDEVKKDEVVEDENKEAIDSIEKTVDNLKKKIEEIIISEEPEKIEFNVSKFNNQENPAAYLCFIHNRTDLDLLRSDRFSGSFHLFRKDVRHPVGCACQ